MGGRARHGGDGRRRGAVDERGSILQSCRLDILCFDGLSFIFTAVFLCGGAAVLKSSIFLADITGLAADCDKQRQRLPGHFLSEHLLEHHTVTKAM